MTDKTPQQLFAEALAAFQKDAPQVGKGSKATVPTKNGGSFSYDYASLPDLLASTLPALTANGLSYTAAPAMTEYGFVLRFALLHTGGHREEGTYPLPDPSRSTPQQIGSAVTYGRRYCFCAVTGIAPDEDDDGQAASDARASDPLPRAPRRPNATTRHTADTLPRDDEWTTPLPVTDTDWLEDVNQRLVRCSTVAEVRGLWAEAVQVFAEHRLAPDDSATLKAAMDERAKELKGELAGASS